MYICNSRFVCVFGAGVSLNIYFHSYACVYEGMCMYECMCMYMYVCVFTCMYECIICTCMYYGCMYIYLCICECMYAYVCMYHVCMQWWI